MPTILAAIWTGVQVYLVAILATKAAKVLFAVTVIAFAYSFATDAVDELVAWMATLSEPTINGEIVPILGMMAWMGFFEALAILLGAHLAVLTIRLVMRGVDWL